MRFPDFITRLKYLTAVDDFYLRLDQMVQNPPLSLYYPRDGRYLDRWNAPSSAASSLLLVNCNIKIVVWDVDHLQHISNIDLDFSTHKRHVDLNGLVYVSVIIFVF